MAREHIRQAAIAARDAALAERWEDLRRYWEAGMPTSTVGVHPAVLVLTDVRQVASRGLKGYAGFFGGPAGHAVWFAGMHPPMGAILLVGGHYWPAHRGQHHDEPVFWVDVIWEALPADAPSAWKRERTRRSASLVER